MNVSCASFNLVLVSVFDIFLNANFLFISLITFRFSQNFDFGKNHFGCVHLQGRFVIETIRFADKTSAQNRRFIRVLENRILHDERHESSKTVTSQGRE